MTAENCCEHGDHPAPDGKRFCSLGCQRCEAESKSTNGCDGICTASARAEVKRLSRLNPTTTSMRRAVDAKLRDAIIILQNLES